MTSKFSMYLIAFATLAGSAATAFADGKVQVVTTIPELAWAAAEIGGSRVEARALLAGTENPHFVDAVPEFTRLVAEAQVVCLVGLDLEVGYMPPVLARSGNADVQPGGKGYCEVGKGVEVLEKPTGPVDRSMGDVHPAGNPHFWLSPKALAAAGREIAAALERVDANHASHYRLGLETFARRLDKLSTEVAITLAPVLAAQGAAGDRPVVVEYHKEFAYFFAQYGIRSAGSIEEKPGVPPSAGRLVEVSLAAKSGGVRVALAAEDNPVKTVAKFREISGLPVIVVPTMIQASGKLKTYPELQAHIAAEIVRALGGGQALQ